MGAPTQALAGRKETTQMTASSSSNRIPLQAEYARAIRAFLDAITETVNEAGEQGAPATSLYLPLQQMGATLGQFEEIMDYLVETGRVRRDQHRPNLYLPATAAQEVAPAERERAEREARAEVARQAVRDGQSTWEYAASLGVYPTEADLNQRTA
jgi:hypothetical protein